MQIAQYRSTAIDLNYRDDGVLRIVADAYAKGHYRPPASRKRIRSAAWKLVATFPKRGPFRRLGAIRHFEQIEQPGGSGPNMISVRPRHRLLAAATPRARRDIAATQRANLALDRADAKEIPSVRPFPQPSNPASVSPST